MQNFDISVFRMVKVIPSVNVSLAQLLLQVRQNKFSLTDASFHFRLLNEIKTLIRNIAHITRFYSV